MKSRKLFLCILALACILVFSCCSSGKTGSRENSVSAADGQITDNETGIPEEDVSSDEPAYISDGAIRPEFQRAMDEIKSFYTDYVNVMKDVRAGKADMSRYMDLLSRYQDYADILDRAEMDAMNDAERDLYIRTLREVQDMLYDAADSMK